MNLSLYVFDSSLSGNKNEIETHPPPWDGDFDTFRNHSRSLAPNTLCYYHSHSLI